MAMGLKGMVGERLLVWHGCWLGRGLAMDVGWVIDDLQLRTLVLVMRNGLRQYTLVC